MEASGHHRDDSSSGNKNLSPVASIDEVETFLGVEEETVDILEKEKRLKHMGSSLDALGEPCRSIIEDFYVKDLSMEQISAKFGYTNADNAKNQKYKCLMRLKKLFFAQYNIGD